MKPVDGGPGTGHIVTLDGWRGVAILIVIISHCAMGSSLQYQPWARFGFLGVDIFFVLSGYLITTGLLQEKAKIGSISLRNFYTRRVFRILPLVLMYLGTLCAISVFSDVNFSTHDLIGSLFFFRNFQVARDAGGISTSHFWSLSIEEQFYLVWPLLFLLSGVKRSLWLALSGAFACAGWRMYDLAHPANVIARLLPSVNADARNFRTDLRIDGLMIGCALAILLQNRKIREFILGNFPKETPLLCGSIMLIAMNWSHQGPTLFRYILIALAVASTLIVKEGLAYKWLNNGLLAWVGSLSFSLYVWQQLFVFHTEILHPLGIFNVFPLNIATLLAVAVSCHYLVERPLIRVGKALISSWRLLDVPLARSTTPALTVKPSFGPPSY
jgi:peptidoglycan/LPS O-acetylase OafA/YrhL